LHRYLEDKKPVAPAGDEGASAEALEQEPGQRQLRRRAGLDRLLRQCGLYIVDSLDLEMFRLGAPAAFIYRNRRLHSHGLASYARELQNALNLILALESCPGIEEMALDSLSELQPPLLLSAFTTAALPLEPLLKVKLLTVGLKAARLAFPAHPTAVELDFSQLNHLSPNRLLLLSHILDGCDMRSIMAQTDSLESLRQLVRGLTLETEAMSLVVGMADRQRMRLLQANLSRSPNLRELERRYQAEVSRMHEIWPEVAESFRVYLDEVFRQSRYKLMDSYLDEARLAMWRVHDVESLNTAFNSFREQTQEFPQDRLNILYDLYSMNLERITASLLDETVRRLREVKSLEQLQELWRQSIPLFTTSGMRPQDNNLNLSLAAFFDRRAQELAGGSK
jgi:hypothetical protein